MDRFHKHKWLLGIALISLAGCTPEPPVKMERRGHEIELPAAFSNQEARPEAVAREQIAPPQSLNREIRPSLASEPNYFGNFERPIDQQASNPGLVSPPRMLAPMSMSVPENATMAAHPPAAENPSATENRPAAENPEAGFHTVDVLYATDRKQGDFSLHENQFSDQRQLLSLLGIGAGIAFGFFLFSWILGRASTAKLAGGMAVIMATGAAGIFVTTMEDIEKQGVTYTVTTMEDIEKQGVTYTGGRGELVRGVCRVTVPVSHTRGSVERPSLMKFEVTENQAKHIVLTSVSPLGEDEFETRMGAELAAAEQPDLLVFIHGYNVGFESAVLRTAQIAVDLPFRGVPVCYSWPSQGTLLGYPIDENNAAWTVGHLKQFLGELVDRSGAKSIHVVAHSMGNRAMTSALQQMVYQRGDGPPLFDRVVLAAPDIDADLFRKDLAVSLTQIARQVTLYASSNDQALVASKKVHGYPRAGESGDQIVVVPGVDTIDVSGIDLSLLGHSYYGESEPILRDLYDVLLSRLPAPQRQSLVSRVFQSQVYWQLATGDPITTRITR